jgi:hypothetical protein
MDIPREGAFEHLSVIEANIVRTASRQDGYITEWK